MLNLHAIFNAMTIEQIKTLVPILESYGLLDQIIALVNFTYYKHGDIIGNQILDIVGNDEELKPYPTDNLNHIVVPAVSANVLKMIAIMPICMFESVMKAMQSDLVKIRSDYEIMQSLKEQFLFLNKGRSQAS